ncbi:hypothetical protein ABEF95_007228 [Exophiala dermatitidis]
MSQITKRDADTAFEGAENSSPHALKRQRKRKNRTKEDKDIPQQPETGSSPAPPSSAKRRKNQVVTPQKHVSSPAQASRTTDSITKASKPHAETLVQESKSADDLIAGLTNVGDDNKKSLVKNNKKKKKKKQQKASQVEKSKRIHTDGGMNAWELSSSTGGLFINQDPLLTEDDQFLILPTHSEIQVYATTTSLLVRSFRVDNKSDITSCVISNADPSKVYVTSSRGLFSLWDWTTGERICRHDTGHGLQQVLPLVAPDGKETILALQEGQATKSTLVFDFEFSTRQFKHLKTVLQKANVVPNIRSFADGAVLVACADDRLLVGQSQHDSEGRLELDYTWREVSVSAPILSFDAQINLGKAKSGRKVPFLDVVIGLNNGVIVAYEDLLFKLIGKEKKNSKDEVLARKLHWHRTGVNAVKWSRDRNYIISGGNETVLVIWQLDTNQRQYLPHLSTPILGLTVSATGSAYALRLADNSVMVLSTADLLPFASVSGLALGPAAASASTMALHPTTAIRLVAAATGDAVTQGSRRPKNLTLLQEYDMESNLQLGRQALTRNMTTAKNVAPSGGTVREPNVTHLGISHDGKWLATVDQWWPNEQDIETLYISTDDARTRGAVVETTLKFWRWNEDENTWELVTRVDEPHKPGALSVLGLAVNPTKTEFSTIGSDASIRIWSPKARHRNGVPVKNKSSEQLYTWSSSRTIKCDSETQDPDKPAAFADLAYSDDASVLAASWSGPATSPRYVHLIDPGTGQICVSLPDILSWVNGRLAFAGRYLVAVSQTLNIINTLTTQLVASIALDHEYVRPTSQSPSHLAVNKLDGTVAISISRDKIPRGTKLLVLSLRTGELQAVFETSFTGTLKGLLACPTAPGYLLLDDKNRYRTLKPTGALGPIHSALAETQQKQDHGLISRSLDSIFGHGHTAVPGDVPQAGVEGRRLLTAGEAIKDSKSTATGLDGVLNIITSASAPSPEQLFERVVQAVARA